MEKHNREKETLRELQVRLDFITFFGGKNNNFLWFFYINIPNFIPG